MARRLTRFAIAISTTAVVLSLTASLAMAGEVTGSGRNVDQNQGRSWCSSSGLNDDPTAPLDGSGPNGPERSVTVVRARPWPSSLAWPWSSRTASPTSSAKTRRDPRSSVGATVGSAAGRTVTITSATGQTRLRSAGDAGPGGHSRDDQVPESLQPVPQPGVHVGIDGHDSDDRHPGAADRIAIPSIEPGTYRFACTIHDGMAGTFVVVPG